MRLSTAALTLILLAGQNACNNEEAKPTSKAPPKASSGSVVPAAPATPQPVMASPTEIDALSAVVAFVNTACPSKLPESETTAETRERVDARSLCIAKRAEASFSEYLAALKSVPDQTKRWKTLGEELDRWAGDACEALEELNWIDLKTRLFGHGSAEGLTRAGCTGNQQGTWAILLEKLHARYIKELLVQAAVGESIGLKSRTSWLFTLQQARLTPQKLGSYDPEAQKPDPERFKKLLSLLERIVPATEGLAKSICGLIPESDDKCAGLLSNWLFALIYIKDYS